LVSLGLVVLHQAGSALLLGGLGRPREALLLAGVVFLLYPLWRIARSTGRPAEVLRFGPAPLASYPLAVVALVGAMPLALAAGELVTEVPTALDEVLASLLRAQGPREWAVTLLAAAVVPALAEELLFRGFLQRGLEPRLGPAAAIAISSLAFGAIHGPGRVIPATLLGAVLGWIAWRIGSVRPVLVAHFVSNTAVVVVANLREEVAGAWDATPPALVTGVGVVLAAAALGGISRLHRPDAAAGAAARDAEPPVSGPRDPV
jgi:membrane protease YdiL (CAAX protease family)